MNFWMLRQMARPSRTASTMVAKLSSAMTMSAASRATSVPSLPMATPMWASRSAGASFTPSPVIATMWPHRLKAPTIRSFCSAVTRAKTRTVSMHPSSPFSSSFSSSAPVSAMAPSSQRPSSFAMATAVSLWSPVIITARTCASAQRRTASFTPSRGGSIIPTRPRKVSRLSMSEGGWARSCSACTRGGSESWCVPRTRRATARTRRARLLISSASSRMRRRVSVSRATRPSAVS